MTIIRKPPSGPFIEVGNPSNLVKYIIEDFVVLPELGVTIESGMIPVPAESEAREALIIVSLAFLNETGFDGAPFGGTIGLQAGPDPINLGGFRFNPIGPGLLGNPLLWTAQLATIIQPGTSFALFGNTNAEGGNIGGAGRIVPAPQIFDGYSVISFILL